MREVGQSRRDRRLETRQPGGAQVEARDVAEPDERVELQAVEAVVLQVQLR